MGRTAESRQVKLLTPDYIQHGKVTLEGREVRATILPHFPPPGARYPGELVVIMLSCFDLPPGLYAQAVIDGGGHPSPFVLLSVPGTSIIYEDSHA